MQINAVIKAATNGAGMRLSSGTADNLRFSQRVSAIAKPAISLSAASNLLLQVGTLTEGYWIQSNIWGAGTLTPGVYTTISGSTYEQTIGRSLTNGTLGAVAARFAWKWPFGTTEVKSYPAIQNGARPGFSASNNLPAGMQIMLQDASIATSAPSGATPGNFMPISLSVSCPSITSYFTFEHQETPTGKGHVSYDIWVQNTSNQCAGFNNCAEIDHEIMIPVNYWGQYGAYPDGRNWAAWSAGSVVIGGRTWHIFHQNVTDPGHFFAWNFTAFEPDPNNLPASAVSLDIAPFINYVVSRGWIPTTSRYLTSIEIGVEPVEGTGDVEIYNARTFLT
jgi:hypothetical protein